METLEAIRRCEPLRMGRSKILYRVSHDECLVELVPSLTSYTRARHDYVAGTEVLRLDFFELAAGRLAEAGMSSAFIERVGPNLYLARYCVEDIPFEVIVKNLRRRLARTVLTILGLAVAVTATTTLWNSDSGCLSGGVVGRKSPESLTG